MLALSMDLEQLISIAAAIIKVQLSPSLRQLTTRYSVVILLSTGINLIVGNLTAMRICSQLTLLRSILLQIHQMLFVVTVVMDPHLVVVMTFTYMITQKLIRLVT